MIGRAAFRERHAQEREGRDFKSGLSPRPGKPRLYTSFLVPQKAESRISPELVYNQKFNLETLRTLIGTRRKHL
jgi:hypothetical protein